jgi:hypothetical protein
MEKTVEILKDFCGNQSSAPGLHVLRISPGCEYRIGAHHLVVLVLEVMAVPYIHS